MMLMIAMTIRLAAHPGERGRRSDRHPAAGAPHPHLAGVATA